jgi:RimJ/RimL family protein N-acetyltransferase
MKIVCKGFIIRPPRKTDLESYHKYINDPLIGRNMSAINYPVSKSESKRFLNSYIKKSKSEKDTAGFIIDIDGECVGAISLGKIVKNHKAKIGYWLASKYRGRGIMTAATKKITEYGFKKYHLKRIYGNVATFNKTSAHVLEKCGFKLEGILKKDRLKNGKYYDNYIYSITR